MLTERSFNINNNNNEMQMENLNEAEDEEDDEILPIKTNLLKEEERKKYGNRFIEESIIYYV